MAAKRRLTQRTEHGLPASPVAAHSTDLPPSTEFLVYTTEDGTSRVQVRLADGTVWLSQRLMAELFGKDVRTINEHLQGIYEDGELDPGATIRKFRIVRTEGNRSVSRLIDHYSLPAILAVGYRVRSLRGTQFRQWATARLEELLTKGFVLDDARLKNPPGPGQPDYFEELLARIRDIRSSEKVFYKKVLAIYETSIDYDPRAESSKRFFQTVQNRMHWAAHGQTAAEVIAARADATKPNMGLTSWTGERPRKADALVAKNYLQGDEIEALNRIVTAYLEFAELQAMNRRPMHMADWIAKLDDFLRLSDREILKHAGKISRDMAVAKAEAQYDMFSKQRAALPSRVEKDFEKALQGVKALETERKALTAASPRLQTRKKP